MIVNALMPDHPNIMVYTILPLSGGMIEAYYTLRVAYEPTFDPEPSHWMIPLWDVFCELSEQD